MCVITLKKSVGTPRGGAKPLNNYPNAAVQPLRKICCLPRLRQLLSTEILQATEGQAKPSRAEPFIRAEKDG